MVKPKIIKNAVRDIDGNAYDGVEINGMLWMASNLRTVRLADGTPLGRYRTSELGTLPYFEYPSGCENNLEKIRKFGLHYNFEAVNTGLLAPDGWRVSTIADWDGLLSYLAGSDEYNLDIDEKRPYLAATGKSLCANEAWMESVVVNSIGHRVSENNSTGFGLYPNGRSLDIKSKTGQVSYLWFSDVFKENDEYAWAFRVWQSDTHVAGTLCARAFGFGVRCVKC
jgi:uncharacterized protein (TIGR02145 family)